MAIIKPRSRIKVFSRISSLLLSIFIALSILAGCGKSTSVSSTPSSTTGKSIDLRYSWWGADARHNPYQAAIKKYQELHPGVTISGEFQGYDGYKQKLLTQIAGGTEPDIMTIDPPWYPELTSKGDFFVDIKSKPDLFNFSDIDQNIIRDYGTFQGKLIGIPMGYNSRTVIINADLAKKVGGLNYGERYTWETLYQDGKKIHSSNPDVYLGAPCPSELVTLVREILKQRTGKQLYDDGFARGFTDTDLLYAFNWISKSYKDGVFQPLGEAGLYESKGEQNPLWVNGKVIMTFQWTAGTTRFEATLPKGTNVDVIPYPQDENKKDGAALLRPIFLTSVSKKSKNVDEALKFMSWFLNDPEAGVILQSSNGTPATKAQRDAVQKSGGLDPLMPKGIQLGMQSAAAKENAPSTNSELDKILSDAISEVAFGRTTPADAVAKTIPLLDKKGADLKAASK